MAPLWFKVACFSAIAVAEILILIPAFSTVYSAPSNYWDILIFVQSWPKAECDQWIARRSGNSCNDYPKGPWTVHGIWPTKRGTRGPNDCDPSRTFNLQEISGLERALEQGWTPIHQTSVKSSFWEHEWIKHGTCADPVLTSQYQYFKQALDWIGQYNMRDVLQRARITPGGQYEVSDIVDGVQSVLKVVPIVICYADRGNSVLLEVRICFDQSLNLVNCDAYTNCARGRMVEYPSP